MFTLQMLWILRSPLYHTLNIFYYSLNLKTPKSHLQFHIKKQHLLASQPEEREHETKRETLCYWSSDSAVTVENYSFSLNVDCPLWKRYRTLNWRRIRAQNTLHHSQHKAVIKLFLARRQLHQGNDEKRRLKATTQWFNNNNARGRHHTGDKSVITQR